MDKATIVIPARKGSKGFPGKNNYLFDYTARQIPLNLSDRVVFTSDDDELLERAEEYNFKTLKRKDELSTDETKMGDVIKDVAKQFDLDSNHDIITLYLTYPQRTWMQVSEIYDFYKTGNCKSLLCKKEIKTHPYMCFYEEENFKGSKVIDHNLYRRQEYPKCFESCHYVVITKVNILDELDNNLYHKDTCFYKLENKIVDVDYLKDFDDFRKDNEDG